MMALVENARWRAIDLSSAIKIGDDGARDVVPHAEDGARDGGEGIGSEMERGQAAGQSW